MFPRWGMQEGSGRGSQYPQKGQSMRATLRFEVGDDKCKKMIILIMLIIQWIPLNKIMDRRIIPDSCCVKIVLLLLLNVAVATWTSHREIYVTKLRGLVHVAT